MFEAISYNRLKARAIIAPHVGYTYSRPTAVFACKPIDPTDFYPVFHPGPSHHTYYQTSSFSMMNKQQDSDKHSLEIHLPYIAKVFEKYQNPNHR